MSYFIYNAYALKQKLDHDLPLKSSHCRCCISSERAILVYTNQ